MLSPISSSFPLVFRSLKESTLTAFPASLGSWITSFAAVINPKDSSRVLLAVAKEAAETLRPSESPALEIENLFPTSLSLSIMFILSLASILKAFIVEIMLVEAVPMSVYETFLKIAAVFDKSKASFKLYP